MAVRTTVLFGHALADDRAGGVRAIPDAVGGAVDLRLDVAHGRLEGGAAADARNHCLA